MKITQTAYHLVIGLGISGMSMARFLHAIGEKVVATDLDASRTNEASLLNELGIETQIGYHDQVTFNNAQVLIPSPGIPLSAPHIRTAAERGVPVTGELDIFQAHCSKPLIAITGTNGKTTTTRLIGDMLTADGKKAFVCGNIGTPLVDLLFEKQEADIVVAEVSSFQLDLCKTFAPKVGVLLNITEDHMDRYPDFGAYQDSKWSLFKRQDASCTAVINNTIADFNVRTADLDATVRTFTPDTQPHGNADAVAHGDSLQIKEEPECILNKDEFPILFGRHNCENAAAAILACSSAGASMDGILKGLKTFQALPHRISYVETINGISFYNDSKATNTDAVIRALECFETPVVLILGGREKGTDFTDLIQAVKARVSTIVAIGESKEKIQKIFTGICPVIEADTMAQAVQSAFETAEPSGTVLLSPACASFDMYDNYGHRGDDFIEQVNNIKGNLNE